MVCLEALALGRPVLATKCGGPEEIIRHQVNGLLVENENPSAIAEGLLQIGQSPEILEHWHLNTQLDFQDKFNPANLSHQLLSSYRE